MNGGSGWNWDDGTITVADGVVYFADGGLKASDAATGELLWHFQAPRHWYSSICHFFRSPPTISGGVVYFGVALSEFENEYYALDAATGELLWRFESPL